MISKICKEIELKELLKFLIGGGTAVLVDAVVYALLKQIISISTAKTSSYIAGAIVGFLINKFWTFESKGGNIDEIWKYALLYLFSALANTIVNHVVLCIVTNVLFAFLCATATSTVINFIGQKFFVFSKKKRGLV